MFYDNLANIEKFIANSSIYNNLKSPTENAAIQLLQIAINSAMALEKQELEKIQMGAEILLKVAQIEAVIRGVSDNAAINRANGYVGLVNAVCNAEDLAQVAGQIDFAYAALSQIDLSKLSNFDTPISELKKIASNLSNIEKVVYSALPNQSAKSKND